jgi:hypothetical protein
MSRPTFFPEWTKEHLAMLLKKNKNSPCFRKIQAVYLGSIHEDTDTIATITLYTPEYVRLLFWEYRKIGDDLFLDRKSGMRQWARLNLVEEEAFLAPFIAWAEKAGILIASDVHKALKKKLEKETLSVQTTYNLLHRHDWRKIAPRPYHPKRDNEARELWKAEIFPPKSPSSKTKSVGTR